MVIDMINDNRFSIDKLLCVMFCIFALTPVVSHNHLDWIIITGGLWMAITIFLYVIPKLSAVNRDLCSMIFLVLLWCSIELMYRYFGISSATSGNYFVRMGYYIPFLMGILYINRNRKIILFTITATLVISVLDNIRLSVLYPEILQSITKSDYSDYRTNLNFGAANFGYCVLILQLVLWFLICTGKLEKAKKKLAYFIIVAIVIYLLCLSSTSILILLVVFDALIYLTFPMFAVDHYTSKVKVIRLCIVILLILLIIFLRDRVLGLLGDRVSVRISALFTGNDWDIYITRPKLAFVSTQSWLKDIRSFFFGQGLHLDASDFSFSGQHSAIIDQLAYYGVTGIIIPGIAMWKYSRNISRILSEECLRLYHILITLFIINNIINTNIKIDAGVMTFLFVPAALIEITEMEER